MKTSHELMIEQEKKKAMIIGSIFTYSSITFCVSVAVWILSSAIYMFSPSGDLKPPTSFNISFVVGIISGFISWGAAIDVVNYSDKGYYDSDSLEKAAWGVQMFGLLALVSSIFGSVNKK